MRTHKIGNKQIWGSEHLTHRRRERHEIVTVFIMPLCCWSNVLHIMCIYMCVCVRRYDIPQTLALIACFPRTNRIELLSSARLKRSVSISRCWLAMNIWSIDMYLKIKSVYQTLSMGKYCVYKTVKHKDSGITSLGITNLTPHSAQCSATAWPGLATPWSQIVWCKWLDPRPQIKAWLRHATLTNQLLPGSSMPVHSQSLCWQVSMQLLQKITIPQHGKVTGSS